MRFIPVLMAVLICSCSNIKVRKSYNKSVDFSKYDTWCWVNDCNPSPNGSSYLLPNEIIANVISIEMREKGFIEGGGNSDLMLNIHILTQDDSVLSAHNSTPEDLVFWTSNYKIGHHRLLAGSLIIDISDRKEGKLIWRSAIEKYTSPFSGLKNTDIKESIRQGMKGFPPEMERENKRQINSYLQTHFLHKKSSLTSTLLFGLLFILAGFLVRLLIIK